MSGKTELRSAASIRARLLDHAKRQGEDYQRVLTRFAIERLLFRLSRTSTADQYVLKGAMLFVTWPDHAFRSTGDLDLLGHGDPAPAAIIERFTEICRVHADDGIVFDANSLKVEPVREADRYQGVELSVKGELARAVIHVRVDIGFGDHVHPMPVRRAFPSLLPDLPAATLLMYPPEAVVAEKFEAMVRFGEANGRIKDFYDIWLASRTFPFELPCLVEAIAGTFRRREAAIPRAFPAGLTASFATVAEERGLWSGFLRRSPPTLAPPAFVDVQEDLRRFFQPVLASLTQPDGARSRWDPALRAWH